MKFKKLAAALCAAALSLTAMSVTAFANIEEGLIIDENTFPDEAFRTYVLEHVDQNNTGILSDQEIESTTYISVEGYNISSLEGIQYFTELTDLSCRDNLLTELDVSGLKELRNLNCPGNYLTSLDVSGCTKLESLMCGGDWFKESDYFTNNLTSLDLSDCPLLTDLDCGGNKIKTLDLSGCPLLSRLVCCSNEITSLNIENCKELTYIDCGNNWFEGYDSRSGNNKLKSLDLSGYTKLENLSCVSMGLEKLDVSNCSEMIILSCEENLLTDIDLSNCTKLTELFCTTNKLKTLDLRNCNDLMWLFCSENELTSLDISKNTNLNWVQCEFNDLTSLDASNNAELNMLWCRGNKLTSLMFHKNLLDLDCSQNELASLDLSKNTELINLTCGDNKFDSIDISNNPELCWLNCCGENTIFPKIDISNNEKLKNVYFNGQDMSNEEGISYYCIVDKYEDGQLWFNTSTKIITEPESDESPELVDEKTNITVTGEIPEDVKLVVKEIDTKAETAEVLKTAVAVFDITLTNDDNIAVQPDGKIEISIPCETKGLYLYHIKDDGTKEYIESKYVDGCYVFTTDHLSVYALMKDKPEEKPETKPETTPETKPETKPADDSNKPTGSAAGIAFAGIALAGAALMASKKRK